MYLLNRTFNRSALSTIAILI